MLKQLLANDEHELNAGISTAKSAVGLGNYVDMEDSYSNYKGANFGRKLYNKYKLKKVILKKVADDFKGEIGSFSPLASSSNEKKFINAFDVSENTGLGDIIHNMYDLKSSYGARSTYSHFDYYNETKRRNVSFVGTTKFINMKGLTEKAVGSRGIWH